MRSRSRSLGLETLFWNVSLSSIGLVEIWEGFGLGLLLKKKTEGLGFGASSSRFTSSFSTTEVH